MIKSMTGFGKAQAVLDRGTFSVDIRALNSKQLDVNVRIPSFLREQEAEIRSLLATKLERGKIDMMIQLKNSGDRASSEVNTEIVQTQFEKLKQLKESLQISNDILFSEIMKLPDSLVEQESRIDETEWGLIRKMLSEALDSADEFRKKEGAGLEAELLDRVGAIENHLIKVSEFEEDRMQSIRTRITSRIEEFLRQDAGSASRFEEEMIYYLEKLDISEEKQRLAAHCQYFRETSADKASQGRKLGFITQEMGREINTIGSKSNHAGMQKIVVLMKDELEKIKEQLNNVL
ncbi:MAG: YicC family protein [Bacteroidetes bacterium]|nr:YicC family protein [Bacteroidota bacterium]